MARKEKIMSQFNNRDFISNLRAIFSADRNNAARAKSWPTGANDAEASVSRFEYASDDEVEKSKNDLNSYIYTPISWVDRNGTQGSAFLISDPGRFGHKIFGMESFDGLSFTPNGTKNFLNNILNNGGNIYYNSGGSTPEKGNPLKGHNIGTIDNNTSERNKTTSFSAGMSSQKERNQLNDAMNFMRRYREIGPNIFDNAYYKDKDL